MLKVGYPTRDEEIGILQRFQESDPLQELEPVANPEQFEELQKACKRTIVSESIRQYISDLVGATRRHDSLRYGASPRGSLGLMRAGQALAMVRGRNYVLPDDIKYLANAVLSHRLILSDAQRMRGETTQRFLDQILDEIPVPIPLE